MVKYTRAEKRAYQAKQKRLNGNQKKQQPKRKYVAKKSKTPFRNFNARTINPINTVNPNRSMINYLNRRNDNVLTVKQTELAWSVRVATTTETKYQWRAIRPQTFRGLRMYVGEFANFRFRSLKYRYVPDVSALTNGQVAMGYNEASLSFTGNHHALAAMKATHYGSASIPGKWMELMTHNHESDEWLVNTGAGFAITQRHVQGYLHTYGWGATSGAALGHIEVSYVVQFDNRILEGVHTAMNPTEECIEDVVFGTIQPNEIELLRHSIDEESEDFNHEEY